MPAESKTKFRQAPKELEETIRAIRSGEVDALVIETSSGDQIYTIEKSSNPYQSVEELKEVLQAIRNGQVDALVVTTPSGDRVFTLEGADQPYRIFMQTMQEGAATLAEDGTVLFANARFAEIIGIPLERFIGLSLASHAEPEEKEKMRRLLEESQKAPATAELNFKTSRGRNRLRLSFSALPDQEHDNSKQHAVCVVATDVTQLFEAGESLRKKEEALQQLSARLMKSQDEERGRLGRELHDSLGQILIGLKMELSGFGADSKRTSDEVVAECNRLLDSAIREVRTMSYLLYPPMLEEMGLRTAIEWYLEGFRQRSGIVVKFDAAKEFHRLPSDTELALFRVVQESMTNVHRHSGSPTAQVRLRREDHAVVLEIQDQGRGAPVAALHMTDDSVCLLGVGLRGMNERVRQIGGKLELSSSGVGTLVRATVPLRMTEDSRSSEAAGA